jgi:hypothetical protein
MAHGSLTKRKGVMSMFRYYLRYVRYTLTALQTVAFDIVAN